MKSIPAALLADYASNPTTFAEAIRIQRTDGRVYGFTSHDENADIVDTIGGSPSSTTSYLASQGFDASAIVTAAGTEVGNLEITTLNDGTLFTFSDIMNGLWINASFLIFRYNWSAPSHGIEELLAGTFGEIEVRASTLHIELRDLRQYLQNDVGSLTSKTCRYRLGSTSVSSGGFCLKDVSGAPFTVTGSVTSAGQQSFTDSSRGEAADYFGDGLLTWLTGNNAGRAVKIKSFTSAGSPGAGTFTLAAAMFGVVQVGDTYRAVAGCRKRFEEDCRDKFANQLNFGGEPHRRGLNNLTEAPGG